MRRYAPSNVVLCLSRGRPATLCFELIDCVDRQMDGQSIFAVPVKGLFDSRLARPGSQHLVGRKGPPLHSGGLLHGLSNRQQT